MLDYPKYVNRAQWVFISKKKSFCPVVRQILTLYLLVEDTKLKGIFLVMLTILIQKITDKLRFICSLQAVSKLPGGISTLTTRRKTENPGWRFVGKQASHALFVNVGRKRFPQKKCQNKLACVPVSMRCKISRRSSCNQISSQSGCRWHSQ